MHPIIPLLQFLRAIRVVDGRKKLQKMVHILKHFGAPFSEKFEYSYYGMYSSQLSGEIQWLATDGLVNEENSGQTVRLQAEPKLDALIEEFGVEKEPDWIPMARKLSEFSPQVLEGISTWFFLEQGGRQGDALRQKLLELKPHLVDKISQIEEHVGQLKSHTEFTTLF